MISIKDLKYRPLLGIFLALTASGCGSIMHGRTQPLSFKSNPKGARVTLNGRLLGATPVTVNVDRKKDQTVDFEKEGYKPVRVRLESRLSNWFRWGNLFLGLGLSPLFSTTDGVNGAVYQYSPDQYMVSLKPTGAAVPLETHTRPVPAKRDKAKEYIIWGYKDIIQNLNKGEGEHLNSLLILLKVAPDGRPRAIKELREIAVTYPDIADFADHAVEAFP